MMLASQIINQTFFLAAVCYTTAFVFSMFKTHRIAVFFLVAGLLSNLVSMGARYTVTFPMLPLYQGPFFIPFFMGAFTLRSVWSNNRMGSFSLFFIAMLSFIAVFFPNTHYLPFLHFKTIMAHLFFLFGVLGKAFFLIAGITGGYFLTQCSEQRNTEAAKIIGRQVLFGFSFWTLSVFSGALWSYLGWGTPIVWDDPIITTTMASWLFYGLFLHLHLTPFGNVKYRPFFAAIGALWVLLFNCLPDMGKFMIPRF